MGKGSCCPSWLSWVVLIAGILYLLQDWGTIQFWTFSWYTVAFIIWGLYGVMSNK